MRAGLRRLVSGSPAQPGAARGTSALAEVGKFGHPLPTGRVNQHHKVFRLHVQVSNALSVHVLQSNGGAMPVTACTHWLPIGGAPHEGAQAASASLKHEPKHSRFQNEQLVCQHDKLRRCVPQGYVLLHENIGWDACSQCLDCPHLTLSACINMTSPQQPTLPATASNACSTNAPNHKYYCICVLT